MANLVPSAFSDNNFLSDGQLQRLAHELARNLKEPAEVFAEFGISAEIFAERIRPSETFSQYYAESFAMWHGTANLPDRVKTKAAMMFEEWLPEAHRILHDPAANLPPKVQLAMFLGKLGGLEPQPLPSGASSGASVENKVHVTINLGHGRQIVIEKKLDKTIEGDAVDITPTPVTSFNTQFTGVPGDHPKPEGELRAVGVGFPSKPNSSNG